MTLDWVWVSFSVSMILIKVFLSVWSASLDLLNTKPANETEPRRRTIRSVNLWYLQLQKIMFPKGANQNSTKHLETFVRFLFSSGDFSFLHICSSYYPSSQFGWSVIPSLVSWASPSPARLHDGDFCLYKVSGGPIWPGWSDSRRIWGWAPD